MFIGVFYRWHEENCWFTIRTERKKSMFITKTKKETTNDRYRCTSVNSFSPTHSFSAAGCRSLFSCFSQDALKSFILLDKKYYDFKTICFDFCVETVLMLYTYIRHAIQKHALTHTLIPPNT